MKKIIVNAECLAEAFAVTPRHVNRYVESGMPREGAGCFDFSKCVRWFMHRMEERFARSLDGAGLMEAEARVMRAHAKIMELKLEQYRQELVSKQEIDLGWKAMTSAARKRFKGVPREFASLLAKKKPDSPQEWAALMSDLIYQALCDLSTMDIPRMRPTPLIQHTQDPGLTPPGAKRQRKGRRKR
jgi:phage terminase Nu1 subunit (DNA packaging protein)